MSSDFEKAAQAALAFRDARDWRQFHNPKDLAVSIAIETGELLETFQWSGADTQALSHRDATIDELADVLIYAIYLADALGVDLAAIVQDKIARNETRYTVERSRGVAGKEGRD